MKKGKVSDQKGFKLLEVKLKINKTTRKRQ